MNLSSLKPAAGSVKTLQRIGRGPGSGLGGTSTRGHKGAKSCSVIKKLGLKGVRCSSSVSSLKFASRRHQNGWWRCRRYEFDMLQSLRQNKGLIARSDFIAELTQSADDPQEDPFSNGA